jgi:iron complex transport system ATP-binding protein
LAQKGTTILMITHHIADIIPAMHRVLLMRDGRIVGDGARRELLTSPVLSDLFNTPVQLTEHDGFYHAW